MRKAGDLPFGGAGFWRLASAAEVEQHGENAARVTPARGEAELAEDARHIFLHGAERDHELVCDPLVRAALGHQFEYLAFARRQLIERVVAPTLREERRNDDRVDR